MKRERDVYYWQERSTLKNLNTEWKEHIVFKIIDKDGYEGVGAATPESLYGETFKTTMAVIELLRRLTENFKDLSNLYDFEKQMNNLVKKDMASKTAVSLSICDYINNKKDLDISKMFFKKQKTENTHLQKIFWKRDLNILNIIDKKNIKLEFLEKPTYNEVLETLKLCGNKNLWLDFRGKYNHYELRKLLKETYDYNIMAIEQPVSTGREYHVSDFTSDYAIFWDESIEKVEDILRINNIGTGFVLDITKFGGILNIKKALELSNLIGAETMLSTRLEHPQNLKWAKKIENSFDFIDIDINHYIDKTSK